MNSAPFLWEGGVISWKVLGRKWMGVFGGAFCCITSIWFLKMRLFTSCLNLTCRKKQERPFSSEATISPKASSSPFFTYFENFCWIVLLGCNFFCFFPMPELRSDTMLDLLWFLLELSLGLVMLWFIFHLTYRCNVFDFASNILPVSSLEIAVISSFLSPLFLLLSALSLSFFKLLLLSFFTFRKLLSQARKL